VELVEVRGESVRSVCHSADAIDYRTLLCEISIDSELDSTISKSSGDSSEQVDSKFSKMQGGSEPHVQNFFKLCQKFRLIMLIKCR